MTDENSRTRALLIDLEGTLHWKGSLLPGVLDALARLRRADLRMLFLTNSDGAPPETLIEKLAAMGLHLETDELYTPVTAAKRLVDTGTGGPCRVLAAPSVAALFPGPPADGRAAHVVVGDCGQVFSFEMFNEAFRDLREGADLVVLQPGRFYVREDGEYLDTGSFAAMLEYASGVPATVVGKPAPAFFSSALATVGVEPGEAMVIGDDVTTDMAGARAIGARPLLVRTGKFTVAGEPSVPDGVQTVDSFADVPDLLGVA